MAETNENEEVVYETTVTEKPTFKEKASGKLQWLKDHKKGVIIGIVAGALGVAATIIGVKTRNDSDDVVDYQNWTDENGAQHVAYIDGDTNENVEVISTPVEVEE